MSARQKKSGAEILTFLRSFEGAASAFADERGSWSLWVPEIRADGHPITPGSQIFFPVILRHGQKLSAIRFFYDCRSGKVKFYTGAIPEDLAGLPEFENAVSELFRHTLPVEPIRQRQLRKSADLKLAPPVKVVRPFAEQAEPVALEPPSAVMNQPPGASPSPQEPAPEPEQPESEPQRGGMVAPQVEPASATAEAIQPPAGDSSRGSTMITLPRVGPPAIAAKPSAPAVARPTPIEVQPPPAPVRVVRTARIEMCDRTSSVLKVLILVFALLGLSLIGAYVYLTLEEDPGVKHHRLQLEQMRMRQGR